MQRVINPVDLQCENPRPASLVPAIHRSRACRVHERHTHVRPSGHHGRITQRPGSLPVAVPVGWELEGWGQLQAGVRSALRPPVLHLLISTRSRTVDKLEFPFATEVGQVEDLFKHQMKSAHVDDGTSPVPPPSGDDSHSMPPASWLGVVIVAMVMPRTWAIWRVLDSQIW